MEEETRRRLGIALAILGFVIMWINGASVIGHYLVGWSIPSGTAVGITVGISDRIQGREIDQRSNCFRTKAQTQDHSRDISASLREYQPIETCQQSEPTPLYSSDIETAQPALITRRSHSAVSDWQ